MLNDSMIADQTTTMAVSTKKARTESYADDDFILANDSGIYAVFGLLIGRCGLCL